MMLDERLRAIAQALPDDGSVSFTRSDLLAMLAADALPVQPSAVTVDLTVADVARLLDRAPGTVRGWCAAGELTGAYRLHGREWRIPPSAVNTLMQRQAEDHAERGAAKYRPLTSRGTDLNAWRSVNPNGQRAAATYREGQALGRGVA